MFFDTHSMHYTLTPNPLWTPDPQQPKVTADIEIDHQTLFVTFDVIEMPSNFRCECTQDGDPCWQDSCVEVFLKADTGYFNFEFNSAGCCLAEHGLSRSPRRRFEADEYALILRRVLQSPQTMTDGKIHWSLHVEIPRKILNLPSNSPILGNLYKCASCAEIPNYLSVFPIETPAPDFHRPEFFQKLI